MRHQLGRNFLVLLLIFIITAGQGCLIKIRDDEAEQKQATDGGFYQTADSGATWIQKNDVYAVLERKTLSATDTEDIVFDPSRSAIYYLMTSSEGVYFTLDRAESWHHIDSLPSRVADFAPDPKNECVAYAAVSNQILKSINCLRNFSEVFHTEPAGRKISSVAVDPQNANIVYAANSSEVYRSKDAGVSWTIISRLTGNINDIRTRVVGGSVVLYAVTETDFVFRSVNRGEEWTGLKTAFKKESPVTKALGFEFGDFAADGLVAISRNGIFYSGNGGNEWTKVPIISGAERIYAFAIDPKDRNTMYYATEKTLYSTVDAGQNWSNQDIVLTDRIAKKLIIDKIDPKKIYMIAGKNPNAAQQKK